MVYGGWRNRRGRFFEEGTDGGGAEFKSGLDEQMGDAFFAEGGANEFQVFDEIIGKGRELIDGDGRFEQEGIGLIEFLHPKG